MYHTTSIKMTGGGHGEQSGIVGTECISYCLMSISSSYKLAPPASLGEQL
jgi:hypothetical protein